MSWMGQTSKYEGPSVLERKEVRKKSDRSFYVRTSTSTEKLELRQAFEAAGCVVTDVRVVYDGMESTGVAYVDVSDDASIEKGLSLDGTKLHEEPLKIRRNMNAESLRKLVKKRAADGSGGDAQSTEKRPCFAFQKGTCARGEYCKFSHGDEGTAGESVKNRSTYEPERVCYNFQKGKCTRGADCKFSHGDATQKSSSSTAPNPTLSSTSPTSTSTSTSSTTSMTSADAVPICRKFLLGKCNRGSCKFLHQQESRDPTSTYRQTADEYNNRKRSRDEETSTLSNTGATNLPDQQQQCRPVATMKVKKKQKQMNEKTRQSEESKSKLSGDELKKINSLLAARQTARDSKDWSKADQLRDQLKNAHNVIVKDSKKGPVWAVGSDWKKLMNVSR